MIADLAPEPTSGIAFIAMGVVLALVGFAAFFVLIWSFVVFLISRVGDWHRLATEFATGAREAEGQRHEGLTGWIGKARYRGCLTLTMAPDGFFLEVPVFFRIAHPRLFIPWTALGERREKRIMRWDLLVCEVGAPRLGVVALPADRFKPPT